MTNTKSIVILTLLAVPATLLLTAGRSSNDVKNPQSTRGKYLVAVGGCNDCHTPLTFTDKGPVPDLTRMLSGHPEAIKLSPPNLKAGPWFAATAGMTAWAGPWGISYAANLTPDITGLGTSTEEMFVKAMKTGKHIGHGRDILLPRPWQRMSALNDDDLKAIFAYLRTIPPVKNRVPLTAGPTNEVN